jgi:hypothetical protein
MSEIIDDVKRKKTALCFACTGRSIEYTFDNIKENLIDRIDNHDIFLYLTKGKFSDSALKKFEKENVVNFRVVDEVPIDLTPYTFRPDWPPAFIGNLEPGRQVYLQMIKSRSMLNDMIDETGNDYDRVIFSRLDVLYDEPFKKEFDDFDLDFINIPDFHNWGGYNDRFAISNRNNMRKYFSLFDRIDEYSKEGVVLHAETNLKLHLDRQGAKINYFPIRFIRVRGGGELHESVEKLNKQWSGIV